MSRTEIRTSDTVMEAHTSHLYKLPQIKSAGNKIDRTPRLVTIKARAIKGLMGAAISSIGPFIARDATPERFAHFGLQIGDRAYELHCDNDNQKHLLVYRLTADQIWKSDVNEVSTGFSNLTDEEIDAVIRNIEIAMKNRGRYDVFRNNCQMFIQDLWYEVCTLKDDLTPQTRDGLASNCPEWFKLGREQVDDMKEMLIWIDVLEPMLSAFFTVFSPNNFTYWTYSLMFWAISSVLSVVRLSAVSGMAVGAATICVSIVFVRCAWIYSRGYYTKLRRISKAFGWLGAVRCTE